MHRRSFIQAGAAACGALVLLLSAIGLYGAVAVGVGQRRREIGVRMALGARGTNVVGMIVRRGMGLAVTGAVLGLVVTLAGARWPAQALQPPAAPMLRPPRPPC